MSSDMVKSVANILTTWVWVVAYTAFGLLHYYGRDTIWVGKVSSYGIRSHACFGTE
jgi:hypothetical protein